jgi:hypothetical protein
MQNVIPQTQCLHQMHWKMSGPRKVKTSSCTLMFTASNWMNHILFFKDCQIWRQQSYGMWFLLMYMHRYQCLKVFTASIFRVATFLPWRWQQNVHIKYKYILIKLYNVTYLIHHPCYLTMLSVPRLHCLNGIEKNLKGSSLELIKVLSQHYLKGLMKKGFY